MAATRGGLRETESRFDSKIDQTTSRLDAKVEQTMVEPKAKIEIKTKRLNAKVDFESRHLETFIAQRKYDLLRWPAPLMFGQVALLAVLVKLP